MNQERRWACTRLRSRWAVCKDADTLARALKCARGVYQRDLVLGREQINGNELRQHRGWGKLEVDNEETYARSRENFLIRLSEARVPWSVVGYVFVIGLGPGEVTPAHVREQRRREADACLRATLTSRANTLARRRKNAESAASLIDDARRAILEALE